jgi:hypothetical protein
VRRGATSRFSTKNRIDSINHSYEKPNFQNRKIIPCLIHFIWVLPFDQLFSSVQKSPCIRIASLLPVLGSQLRKTRAHPFSVFV